MSPCAMTVLQWAKRQFHDDLMNISQLALPIALYGVLAAAPAPAAAPLPETAQHPGASVLTPAGLRQEMRRLWTEHVVWTREYVVAALGDHPGASAAAGRLLRNQEDIGAAIASFYGAAAGQQLTALLKEHITVAVDVVKAAKGGDKAQLDRANSAWNRNATDIAEFLSKANPHWPNSALVEMMNGHLATTTQEVIARLNNKWDDDVRAYDAVQTHILHMADALTAGIVKQFPEKFSRSE